MFSSSVIRLSFVHLFQKAQLRHVLTRQENHLLETSLLFSPFQNLYEVILLEVSDTNTDLGIFLSVLLKYTVLGSLNMKFVGYDLN